MSKILLHLRTALYHRKAALSNSWVFNVTIILRNSLAWVQSKIAERADAKANKDFAKADGIREELKALGIELEDSRVGTTWRRMG